MARVSAAQGFARPGIHRPNALLFLGPAILVLFVWMIVPLALSLYFSVRRYNLLVLERRGFVGLLNYRLLLQDAAFWAAVVNTLALVVLVLAVTVVLGLMLALLFNRDFTAKNVTRTLAISPFFVMPVVTALMWKNMLFHPVFGLLAWVAQSLGGAPADWLATYPMPSVVAIISWEWTPFATLILLTALQSLPGDQLEAVRIDGAGVWGEFRYVVLPHLLRPISALLMLETIFFLTIFAEIYATTSGGPGLATTTLPYFIYLKALLQFDIGSASAGAVFAVILANVVASFLLRAIASNIFQGEPASAK
ncbi:MAG TPA: sugar ABC transporter permease [bacterium]|nr:sugar ABC transporter permease [bacterium]